MRISPSDLAAKTVDAAVRLASQCDAQDRFGKEDYPQWY
jgi:hypothetical protein